MEGFGAGGADGEGAGGDRRRWKRDGGKGGEWEGWGEEFDQVRRGNGWVCGYGVWLGTGNVGVMEFMRFWGRRMAGEYGGFYEVMGTEGGLHGQKSLGNYCEVAQKTWGSMGFVIYSSSFLLVCSISSVFWWSTLVS